MTGVRTLQSHERPGACLAPVARNNAFRMKASACRFCRINDLETRHLRYPAAWPAIGLRSPLELDLFAVVRNRRIMTRRAHVEARRACSSAAKEAIPTPADPCAIAVRAGAWRRLTQLAASSKVAGGVTDTSPAGSAAGPGEAMSRACIPACPSAGAKVSAEARDHSRATAGGASPDRSAPGHIGIGLLIHNHAA